MAKGEGVTISAAEFVAWLRRYDLADANAARCFGVTGATVAAWSRDGVTGSAAHLIRYLMVEGIAPHYLAKRLAIELSAFGRGLYPRKGEKVTKAKKGTREQKVTTHQWEAKD